MKENFIKKLFKNKKGMSLVEKVMLTAFAVAGGAAVIAWTGNVIIESKNKPISGVLDGNGGGTIQESQIGITKIEMGINNSDGYNPLLTMAQDGSNGNSYAWSYTFSSGPYVDSGDKGTYFTFTEEIYCGFKITFNDNSVKTDMDIDDWGMFCSDHPMSIDWAWECSQVHKIMISEDASTPFTYSGDWEIVQKTTDIGGHAYRIAFIGDGLLDNPDW